MSFDHRFRIVQVVASLVLCVYLAATGPWYAAVLAVLLAFVSGALALTLVVDYDEDGHL